VITSTPTKKAKTIALFFDKNLLMLTCLDAKILLQINKHIL